MKNYLLALILTLSVQTIFAGGGNGVPPTPPRGAGPPPGLPIDQYLLGLFVAGVALLIYVTYRKKQKI